MNGRPDLMHLVKAIEREAATLPESGRVAAARRISAAITTAADSLVAIRDDVARYAASRHARQKGGDDGELCE